MNKYRVALLFDRSNNWLKNHIDINVFTEDIKEKYDIKFLYDHKEVYNYDIVFILGYTKLLNKEFLDKNKLNLVIHESKLPAGKGFAPVQWQILEGENIIPVSLIEALEKVDAGDILLEDKIEFNGYELFEDIRTKQGTITIRMINKFLLQYPNYVRKKQEGVESFYRKRKDEDDELDINKSIKEQFNNFRITNNEEYPAYFVIDGNKYLLKIYKGG